MTLDIQRIRLEFPILNRKINGYPIAYFDNAASAQRPLAVINAESDFYKYHYSAVHRGIHSLSVQATEKIEKVRHQVACFLNASASEEIIFVKGTTEGINLVANSWGRNQINSGDNIIISEMEHHANIVPWQMVAQSTGAQIRILPCNEKGELVQGMLHKLIDKHSRLLAITHISNVLGTINPVKELVAYAKSHGLVTLIDGAQAIMHHAVDVQDINCDFYVFSGHKIYGPTGIGVLYGRKILLDAMPPWQGGGSMISQVTLPMGTTWNNVPFCFEAGTPNSAGIIGLGAALTWFKQLSFNLIYDREAMLTNYALNKLALVPELVIYGPLEKRSSIVSFNLGKYHAFDIGSFLDQYGIAIRTGHHCAMPLMQYYGVPAMCRASFAFYNTKEEIDRLAFSLKRIYHLLSG
ncbi:cysteine desulfurase SufS [Candidatus Pantoea carbekii]|uniref:Cysteine desulfurase n=1 Tax=Candidatus Pantoea carbekii TaxID=1235990 RepID=U3U9P7_9GAMM|nr:cysteine desulfurase SufS [Candidatus Pantoea carbekii]AKC32097.1 cysteine desulfurase SufS [Candidatus Pantoea carbekii]BAO00623.1 SufS protein [Candidatus Pantoea carbekii]